MWSCQGAATKQACNTLPIELPCTDKILHCDLWQIGFAVKMGVKDMVVIVSTTDCQCRTARQLNCSMQQLIRHITSTTPYSAWQDTHLLSSDALPFSSEVLLSLKGSVLLFSACLACSPWSCAPPNDSSLHYKYSKFVPSAFHPLAFKVLQCFASVFQFV